MSAITEQLKPQVLVYNKLEEYIFAMDKKEEDKKEDKKEEKKEEQEEEGEDEEPKFYIYTKSSGKFSTEDKIDNKDTKLYKVFMILGFIDAEKQGYIVAAKNIQLVGNILSSKIWKITQFEYIPKESLDIAAEDQTYLTMLDDFLARNNLLYSETYDLTTSIKSYNGMGTSDSEIFSYTRTNFCWNYNIAKNWDVSEMIDIIYPVINGFFGCCAASEYFDNLDYYLIARKDTRRSGMRFLVRGADDEGNCANFAETEEVFIKKEESTISFHSFISVRGSVPFCWTQDPELKLNPTILPDQDFNKNTNVFSSHIGELIQNYSSVVCVNLIDKKKDQKTLGEYYQNLSRNYNSNVSQKLDYCWFDFHSECKGMKYQNLSKLLSDPAIAAALRNFEFTTLEVDNSPSDIDYSLSEYFQNQNSNGSEGGNGFKRVQKGIFRINCVDCLDRCNVVQSVLSRYFAQIILKELFNAPAPNPANALTPFKPVFENNFKLIFADQGDQLSVCYSGTPAIKGDITRTGKRTINGLIADGFNTCKRLYINNLRDGYNQDCHDLFLGKIQPKKIKFKDHNTSFVFFLLPLGIIISVVAYYLLSGFTLGTSEEKGGLGVAIYKMILFVGCVGLSFIGMISYLKKNLIDFHTMHLSKKDQKKAS